MDFLNEYFNYDDNVTICGLTKELNVFYCLNLFKKSNNNLLILTSSIYEANEYYNLFQTYTEDVLLFCMDDFISSMVKAESPELKLTRLNTLDKIKNGKHIVIANLMGYLKFLPSLSEYSNNLINISVNDSINRDEFINKLVSIGYHKESLTTSTGEFSIRGLVIDIFPINEVHPIRIEFDDNQIENIKYYDENTQISINNIDKYIIKNMNEVISSEYNSLYDYMNNPIVVKIDNSLLNASYQKLVNDIFEYSNKNDITDKLMFDINDIKLNNVVTLNNFKVTSHDIELESFELDSFNEDLELLKNNVDKWINSNKKVIICLSSKEQMKKIRDVLDGYNVEFKNIKINHGFIIGNYVVISEYDIGGIQRKYKYQNNLYGSKKVLNYNELNKGDYVVHAAHGIGIYNGIVSLTKDGMSKDYIQIIYSDNDKIYVPANKISNIYKYSDKDGVVPKLNKLNSSSWLKTRQLVQKRIEDISRELLSLYEERTKIFKNPYKSYPEEEIFASAFNYELTKDQNKVINDISMDLSSNYPMDRLLCGDVGFGKTEVAMRAMFKAVLNNEQVVYICPTTILSKQQFNVAKERFADWPIEIALLNRYTTAKEEKIILDKLKKGQIDIVYGTHKLLNNKIEYKNLGLMVVDEEQRFGVKHKEKIKEMQKDINVLTLSATPIPRTLKMALSGLRDLSIIETAPLHRYPVQTYVVAEDDLLIKDVIYKELSRDGQVFILFNNVENIENRVIHLRSLLPGIDIRFAHGQMDKGELDEIMTDFDEYKFPILVCTTIIENGIDIPNANTLIVYDADRLGLSQLYQLRGRVGRSDRIAYAYLMYNPLKELNDNAVKRLNAIKEFTELGSGYRIAMRDLSIRGAGDIFGSSQAGFVDQVGVSLYTKMMENQMKRLKGEEVVEDDLDEKSLINIETHIDDKYVSDEDIKIEVHQMINDIDSFDKFNMVKQILEDRFGKISDSIEVYMYEEWFEKLASKYGIKKVIQTDRMVEVELPMELSSTIKGDKLLYEAYNICPEFKLAYKHKCIVITLYYKNLPEHFIKYLVRIVNKL